MGHFFFSLVLLSSSLLCCFAVLNSGRGEELVTMSLDDFYSLHDHREELERRKRQERTRDSTQTQPEKKAERLVSELPARGWTATFLPGLISWMPKNDINNSETACRLDCVGRWLAPSPTPPPEVLCADIAKRREGEFATESCGEFSVFGFRHLNSPA